MPLLGQRIVFRFMQPGEAPPEGSVPTAPLDIPPLAGTRPQRLARALRGQLGPERLVVRLLDVLQLAAALELLHLLRLL